MQRSGYTLVELLVVISITSILGIIGFVSYKGFSQDQIIIKGFNQIQTVLRLAQSNATSSTFCADNQSTGPWSLVFNGTSIDLDCGSSNQLQQTYALENAEVSIVKGSSCGTNSNLPFRITYSNTSGSLTMSSSGSSVSCLASSSWEFSLRNIVDTSKTKTFTLSKGGAIDVQ